MHSFRVLPFCADPFFPRWSRSLAVVAAAFYLWAAQATAAYGAEAAGEGGKSYGPPWLVIVLVVALGVFITLRPAGRSGEIKRDLKGDL